MSYKYFYCVVFCFLNFMLSVNASGESALVVRFDAELYSSEHFNVSHCRPRKPYYRYTQGMNITVEIFYKSDINITEMDTCIFGNIRLANIKWSVQRIKDIQYTTISLLNIGKNFNYFHPLLLCVMKLNSNSSIPTSQLRCQASFWTSDDDYKYSSVAYFSGYIEASVSTDLDEAYVGHELLIRKNTSLLLKCQAARKAYEHALIQKDKFGKIRIVGRDLLPTVFTINDYMPTYQYGCMEAHKFNKNDVHQAILKLKYVEEKPRKSDDGENNSNDINWLKIVLITCGCFVIIVIMVTAICVSYLKSKNKRITSNQDDYNDSGVYEEIDDVSTEIDVKKNNTHSSVAPTPAPPPLPAPHLPFPPPAERITDRGNSSPPSYNQAVPQGSFISPEDLHLLAIDSYGYQIVEPQFQQLPIQNTDKN